MEIEDLLVTAARARRPSGSEPWDYGWSSSDYRISENAALTHADGKAVSLTAEGVRSLDAAVKRLSKKAPIRDLYDSDELWSIVGSLIATIPVAASEVEIRSTVKSRLERLSAPPQTILQFATAHVEPIGGCIEVGPMWIGSSKAISEALAKAIDSSVASALKELVGSGRSEADEPEPQRNFCAFLTAKQGERARHEAEAAFEDLVAIALMLERDLDARGLHSLRGDSYRPGVDGLRIDRHHLAESLKTNPTPGVALGATFSSVGLFGATNSHAWHGEEPFPLEGLLKDPDRKLIAENLLSSEDPTSRRLRLAARWHAKAHWSADLDDAVIALGICFDVLLREKGNSPGRVHAERFAFLVDEPRERRDRYRRFLGKYYAARSAIVHGGRSSTTSGKFIRDMASDARSVFAFLADKVQEREIRTEKELDSLFDERKWGPDNQAKLG